MTTPPHVTEKQKQWFAKVRESLQAETGKTIDEWVAIARACPETAHKKRLAWFKETHGLGVNYASTIIGAAFDTGLGWDKPDALLDHLWKTPELRAIYDAIETAAKALGDDVVVGPRKSFSGFSRKYQFAAARPSRKQVRLGLALDGSAHGLEAPKSSDSWSDRLKGVVILEHADQVDDRIQALLKEAYLAS